MNRLKTFFSQYNLIFVALLVFLSCVMINSSFISQFSIMALLQDVAIFGFLLLGGALVVLAGGIDLSVGNMASMSSVLAAWVMMGLNSAKVPQGVNLILSTAIPVLVCGIMGLLTGLSVTKLKIPPLIATLGMMWIVKGIGYYFLRGVPTPYPVKAFGVIFSGGFSFIPYSIIYFLVALIIIGTALRKCKWGRSVYAIGGNEYAAYISGIKTDKIKCSVYMISGLFAGFAGILVGTYSTVGYPRACDGYELYVIAAVVMGGIALTGGTGNIWNAALGILVLRLLNKLVLFGGQSGYMEGMIIGSIIIVMLIINSKQGKFELKKMLGR